jgi:hypothetical protein
LERDLAAERLTAENAAFLDERWMPRGRAAEPESADLREAPDGAHQLVELLVGLRPAVVQCISDAAAYVRIEDVDRDLLEGGLDGRHLGEDVDAIGVLVHHPLEAPDLAFDAAESVVDGA